MLIEINLTNQFIRTKIDGCALKKDDGQVYSIAMAVVTPKAVVGAVRENSAGKGKIHKVIIILIRLCKKASVYLRQLTSGKMEKYYSYLGGQQ